MSLFWRVLDLPKTKDHKAVNNNGRNTDGVLDSSEYLPRDPRVTDGVVEILVSAKEAALLLSPEKGMEVDADPTPMVLKSVPP